MHSSAILPIKKTLLIDCADKVERDHSGEHRGEGVGSRDIAGEGERHCKGRGHKGEYWIEGHIFQRISELDKGDNDGHAGKRPGGVLL